MQLLCGVMFNFRCLTGARNIMTKEIQLSKLLLEKDIYKLKVMNCVCICPLLYYLEHNKYDMTAVFGEIL